MAIDNGCDCRPTVAGTRRELGNVKDVDFSLSVFSRNHFLFVIVHRRIINVSANSRSEPNKTLPYSFRLLFLLQRAATFWRHYHHLLLLRVHPFLRLFQRLRSKHFFNFSFFFTAAARSQYRQFHKLGNSIPKSQISFPKKPENKFPEKGRNVAIKAAKVFNIFEFFSTSV